MGDFFIGAIAVLGFVILLSHTKQRNIRVSWLRWALTVLGFVYVVFVLEVVAAFLAEGTIKGAWVMGLILGTPALVWGILLARYVFTGKAGPAAGSVRNDANGRPS